MKIDYAALKAEIINDPEGIGYLKYREDGSDNVIAKLLSAIGEWDVDREIIESYQMIDATDPGELAALDEKQRQVYLIIISAGRVNTGSANTRASLIGMFPEGSQTYANLLVTKGSRAETLFGQGVTVSAEDVAIALRKIKSSESSESNELSEVR